jgi:hypothetical protein
MGGRWTIDCGRWTMDDGRWTIVHKWSGKDACRGLFFLVPSRETDNPFYSPEKMPNQEERMIGTEIFRKLLANTLYSLTDSPDGALIAKMSSSLQTDSPYGAEWSLTVNNNRWSNCSDRGKTLLGNNHIGNNNTCSDLPHRGYLFVDNKPAHANLPRRGYMFVENKPTHGNLPLRGCLFLESNQTNTTMPRRGYLFVENKPTHANLPRRGYLLNEPNISTSLKQNRHA